MCLCAYGGFQLTWEIVQKNTDLLCVHKSIGYKIIELFNLNKWLNNSAEVWTKIY